MFPGSSFLNEPGNIHPSNLYQAVCNMLSFLGSSKSYVLCRQMFLFSLLWLSGDTSVVHLERKYAMIREDVWIFFWSEEGRLKSRAMCACLRARREVSVRASSAVKKSPSASWEEEAWWQSSNSELLRGQPTDTANWHQQRLLVTSNACHTAMQGPSTRPWSHWCGTQGPRPDSFLKVSTEVGLADENRRVVGSKTTPATQRMGRCENITWHQDCNLLSLTASSHWRCLCWQRVLIEQIAALCC